MAWIMNPPDREKAAQRVTDQFYKTLGHQFLLTLDY